MNVFNNNYLHENLSDTVTIIITIEIIVIDRNYILMKEIKFTFVIRVDKYKLYYRISGVQKPRVILFSTVTNRVIK